MMFVKRITAVIAAAALMITASQAAAFAGTYSIWDTTDKNVTIVEDDSGSDTGEGSVSKGGKLISGSTTIEAVRSQAPQDLLDTYGISMDPRTSYCQDVLDAADSIYNEEYTRLMNAKNFSDIAQADGTDSLSLNYSSETLLAMNELGELNELTLVNGVESKKDLPKLSRKMRRSYLKSMNSLRRSDYNDYYWHVICKIKKLIKSETKNIKTFKDYADASLFLMEITQNGDDISVEGILSEDGTDASTLEEVVQSCLYYSNASLDQARSAFEESLWDYADLLLEGYISASNKHSLQKIIDQTVLEMNRKDILTEIYQVYNEGCDAIEKKTGVSKAQTKRISLRETGLFQDKLNKYYSSLRRSDYYANQWDKIDAAYLDYIDFSSTYRMTPTLSRKLLAAFRKTVKNVPTKADLAKRSFRISVKKHGPGKVSPGRTVKYGKSYTVRIKPSRGHKTSLVIIDGSRKKIKSSYTFRKVKRSHTVEVYFK